MSKIFVGNLSWGTTSQSLCDAFGAYGTITDAVVLTDRMTGRSRGFGFVTFSTPAESEAAVAAMNDAMVDGRPVRVNLAQERPPRQEGGGYPPRDGGMGGGYGGQQQQRY